MTDACSSAGQPLIRRRGSLALALPLAIAVIIALPVLVVILLALAGSGEDWPHLLANVVPRSTTTTVFLCLAVTVSTAVIGTGAAAATTLLDFPGRRLLSWLLILPVAMPPWLVAYALVEFLSFTGPPQTLLRSVFGWTSARDYWFPDIRSTGGAAFILSIVLYPYVYLAVRVVFSMQGRVLGDAARSLGAGPWAMFTTVMLPVARPAIAGGVILVLMETLNDIAVAEYLGVRTLTFAVYSTWLNRGSLAGATQIAMVLLVFVVALVLAERQTRRDRRFDSRRAVHMHAPQVRKRLAPLTGWLVSGLCVLPVVLATLLPVSIIADFAAQRIGSAFDDRLAGALVNSVAVATVTASLTIMVALLLLVLARAHRSPFNRIAVRAAGFGYALPGTVLGLGLLYALSSFDNIVDSAVRATLGMSSGLLLTGSGFAVVLACSIRFMALAIGNLEAGFEKLPHDIDDAPRTLGRTRRQALAEVVMPLMKPALGTAFVLVFVDTMKELSATILLRPFGFDTLATLVYENASRGAVEDGSLAALLIMIVSLAPVFLLHRVLIAPNTLSDAAKKTPPGEEALKGSAVRGR